MCPECQEPLFDGCDCVDVDWTADSERQRKENEDGLRQRRDGEKRQEGEQQKEMNDGGMRREKQQQQRTRRQENVGKDTLINTVELRMRQEETQERVCGKEEARRESEERWDIGKGKGKKREENHHNHQTRRKRKRRNRDSEGLGGLVARQRSKRNG